jgi:sulfur relay (sulfurtransferase) DsrC/TusE family protein
MPELDVCGKTYELNEEGFMQKPDEWNEEVASALVG